VQLVVNDWLTGYFGQSGDIAVDTWTHLSFTYDGSRIAKYHNGVLVAERIVQSDAEREIRGADEDDVVIGGCNWDGRSFCAQALIADVRVWSRALSEEEIRDNYSEVELFDENLLFRLRFTPEEMQAEEEMPLSHGFIAIAGSAARSVSVDDLRDVIANIEARKMVKSSRKM
jgi:hypothetical protein